MSDHKTTKSTGGPPPISVIIPAYNEEKRIVPTVRRIVEYFSGRGWEYELLVVDDGSVDGTCAAAAEAAAGAPLRIIENGRNMGKGHSVKAGMLASAHGLRLFTDADLSTPIEDVEKLLEKIRGGADVAFGSRNVAGSNLEVRQNILRESMGKIFNLFIGLLVFSGHKDTQCGFKLFTAECAEAVFPLSRLSGFAFDVEVLTLARSMGFKLAEVPVTWRNDPGTKVGVLSAPISMILEVLRLKWNIITNKYKTR